MELVVVGSVGVDETVELELVEVALDVVDEVVADEVVVDNVDAVVLVVEARVSVGRIGWVLVVELETGGGGRPVEGLPEN